MDRSGFGARAAAPLAESVGIFSGGHRAGDSWLRIARRDIFLAFGRHVRVAWIYRRCRVGCIVFCGSNARGGRFGCIASRGRLWDPVCRRRGNRKFTRSTRRLWSGKRQKKLTNWELDASEPPLLDDTFCDARFAGVGVPGTKDNHGASEIRAVAAGSVYRYRRWDCLADVPALALKIDR